MKLLPVTDVYVKKAIHHVLPRYIKYTEISFEFTLISTLMYI